MRSGRHEEFRNGPEVKIYIWEVLFWPPENVRDFSVLYREGSRRFRSGAHLHGGTHMNVGSGGKAPHPWSRRTKTPLRRNKIISQRDKIKIPKKGDNNQWGRK